MLKKLNSYRMKIKNLRERISNLFKSKPTLTRHYIQRSTDRRRDQIANKTTRMILIKNQPLTFRETKQR